MIPNSLCRIKPAARALAGILVLASIILGVLALNGFTASGASQDNPDLRQTVMRAASGWNTYVDDVAGLSVQYPPNWTLQKGKYVDTTHDYYEIHFDQSYEEIYRGILISVESNPQKLGLREFVNRRAQQMGFTPNQAASALQDTRVADLPAVRATNLPGLGNTAEVFEYKGRIYRIALVEGREGMPVAPQNGAIFEQMLQTVQFR